jgi:hypothetical protein
MEKLHYNLLLELREFFTSQESRWLSCSSFHRNMAAVVWNALFVVPELLTLASWGHGAVYWLRNSATDLKVVGSGPDEVNECFQFI